jgi:hypothetical protein
MPALSVPNRGIFLAGVRRCPVLFWLGHSVTHSLGWLGHWFCYGIGLVGPWGWLGAVRAWGVGGDPCARMCRCVWKIFSTRPRASLKFSGRRIHRQFVSGDLHNCGRRAKLGMGRGDQPHGGLLPLRPAELMRPWEELDGDEGSV